MSDGTHPRAGPAGTTRPASSHRGLPLSTRAAFLTLVCVLVLQAVALPALAHASYVSSEPGKGARLAEAPTQVTVELSETVDERLSRLHVHDGDGNRIDQGTPRFRTEGHHVFVTVDVEDLPHGAYLATWRAVSTVDTHETSGSWGFAVGAYTPPDVAAEEESWETRSALLRLVLYAGFALAMGAMSFLLWIDPKGRALDAHERLALALVAGAAIQAVATAALATYAWPADITFLDLLGFTDVGQGYLVRIVGALVLAGAAWSVRGDVGQRPVALSIAVVSQLAVAFGAASVGHASQQGLGAVLLDFVHLAVASIWLGALAIFLVYLGAFGRRRDIHGIVRIGFRFAHLALLCVIVLVLTGIILTATIRGLPVLVAPWRLAETRWGFFLLAKVVLLSMMVTLAAVNRYLFLGNLPGPDETPHGTPTPEEQDARWAAILPGKGRQRAPFMRTVQTEAWLGVTVLLFAGFLTALSPMGLGTGAGESGPEPITMSRDSETFNVTLRLTPPLEAQQPVNASLLIWERESAEPLAEAIRIHITVIRLDDGEPVDGGERHDARHAGDGIWTLGDITHVLPGDYIGRVEIQTPYIYQESVTFHYTVEP